MGEMPWWYPLLVAARYLGVAPWELAQQPIFWKRVALQARRSEEKAQEQRNKH
jgi:hypothetical protein